MKKYFLFFLLFLVLLNSTLGLNNLTIDFNTVSLEHKIQYNLLKTQPNTLGTLNANSTLYNGVLVNDFISASYFAICPYANTSSSLSLDRGNISLSPDFGLYINQVSFNTVPSVACLIVDLNTEFKTSDYTNFSGIFDLLGTNSNFGLRAYFNNNYVCGFQGITNGNCPSLNCNIDFCFHNQSFNQLVLFGYPETAAQFTNISLSEITITNLLDVGNNELPTCVPKFDNNIKCLNNSFIDFTLDMGCSDSENDTIYYANSSLLQNKTIDLTFGVWICDWFGWGCIEQPNQRILDENFIVFNDTCILSGDIINRYDTHQIKLGYDFYQENMQVLEINGFCSKSDKGVYLDTKYSNDGITATFNIVSVDEGDNFNISLLDGLYANYYTLNFFKNSSGIFVFSIDENSTDFVTNFTDYEGRFIIVFSNLLDTNSLETRVVYGNPPQLTDLSSNVLDLGTNDFRFLYINPSPDTLFHIAEIKLVTNAYVPAFVSSYPSSFSAFKEGYYSHFFYVTDSVHLDSDYDTYSLSYSVFAEDSYQCKANTEFFNVTSEIITKHGASYLDTLGVRDKFANAAYFLYFILLAAFIVFFFKMTHEVHLIIASVLSASICFVYSFLFQASTQMIVFIILISASLAFGWLFKVIANG